MGSPYSNQVAHGSQSYLPAYLLGESSVPTSVRKCELSSHRDCFFRNVLNCLMFDYVFKSVEFYQVLGNFINDYVGVFNKIFFERET